jgi:hypothetical protein
MDICNHGLEERNFNREIREIRENAVLFCSRGLRGSRFNECFSPTRPLSIKFTLSFVFLPYLLAVFVGKQSGRGILMAWRENQLMKRGEHRESNNPSTGGIYDCGSSKC